MATVALAVALLASTGCRSMLPREDDSTLATIGKCLVLVPVTLAVIVVDGSIEDETSVSPVDLLTGDCDDTADWNDEHLRMHAQREMAERELRGLSR